MFEVGRVGLHSGEVEGEIAHNLRRGRDLGHPAEDGIRGGIHVFDEFEVVGKAKRDSLGAQVRELSTRNLVRIHPASRCAEPRFKGGVQGTHGPPVGLEVGRGLERNARIPLGVRQGGDERGCRRLARGAGHRSRSHIDGVSAGARRGEQRGELAARGVVGVHVHGQVEAFAERGHKFLGGARPKQSGHVLDADHVGTAFDDLIGEAQVVVKGVQIFGWVEQVACVADGDLGQGSAGIQHRVDGWTHLRHVVEGVEDAEDVHAGVGRLAHEGVGDLGRVRGVADGVAAAQQHLQVDVRQGFAQRGEALPGVFAEETQRHVVGCAAPGFDREQLRRQPGDIGRHGDEVLGAHPGCQQRLVGVPERRVGHGQRGLRTQIGGEFGGTEQLQLLSGTVGGWLGDVELWQLVTRVHRGRRRAVGLVDGDLGQPVENLGAAVLGLAAAQ